MNTRVSIVLIPVVMILSCQQPRQTMSELSKIEVDSLYTISLPTVLRPGNDMHDYASLQYYDPKTDFYVMGMDDFKENFGALKRRRLRLRAYYRFVEKTAFESVDSLQELSTSRYTRRGLHVQSGDYFVKTRYFDVSYDLFYRIAVYESDTHFFQLLIWMPFGDHCDILEVVDSITNSFELSTYDSQIANSDP